MPAYLTSWQIWGALLPFPAFATLFAACVAFLVWLRKGDWMTVFAITLAMAMLGMVTGAITGSSRESAVGAVLPVVLTVIGGFATYIFTTTQAAVHVLASYVILALSLNLLLGTFWGASLRQDFEDYRASAVWRWHKEIEEAALRTLREKYHYPEPKADAVKSAEGEKVQ